MSDKKSFKKDLKVIKNLYGEDFSKFAKENLSVFLETPRLLPDVLLKTFYPNKNLYNDLVYEYKLDDFTKYIHSFMCKENIISDTSLSPYELLREKNYTLYHCHSDDDIQKFRKYYKEDEKLCTFSTNRYDSCHVFFAVSNDALKLKRESFIYPNRQDAYGTSVISIQFSRGNINLLSIKNRYNHKVVNPDATFSNNLEKIIPGLTRSFEKRYGYNINSNFKGFELSSYVKGNDNRFYKYNYEINGIYYTTTNNILSDKIVNLDREKYILCDYFIIDLVNNKISVIDDRIKDSFIDYYTNITKIVVNKDGSNKVVTFYQGDEVSYIILDKENKIVGYKNDYLESVGDNFLYYNNSLVSLSLPNLRKTGDFFLPTNQVLTNLNMNNIECFGSDCFYSNLELNSIYFPKLKNIGDSFMMCNNKVEEVNLPSVISIGDSFFCGNKIIKKVILDTASQLGNYFLHYNDSLLEVSFPNVISIGNDCFFNNRCLQKLYLPKCENIGDNLLCHNYSLIDYDLSSIKKMGKYFIYSHPEDSIKEKVYRI